jgi:hypothetical protein
MQDNASADGRCAAAPVTTLFDVERLYGSPLVEAV